MQVGAIDWSMKGKKKSNQRVVLHGEEKYGEKREERQLEREIYGKRRH